MTNCRNKDVEIECTRQPIKHRKQNHDPVSLRRIVHIISLQQTDYGIREGVLVQAPDYFVLEELEALLEEKIPIIDKDRLTSFGIVVEFGRIVVMAIFSKVVKRLPNSFGNLDALKELWLNGNRMVSLPDSFGNLTSLELFCSQINFIQRFPEICKNQMPSLKIVYTNSLLEDDSVIQYWKTHGVEVEIYPLEPNQCS